MGHASRDRSYPTGRQESSGDRVCRPSTSSRSPAAMSIPAAISTATGHALGNGDRRDRAVARPAGTGQSGVSDDRAAGAGDHQTRDAGGRQHGRDRGTLLGRSRASCKTSTSGSTSRARSKIDRARCPSARHSFDVDFLPVGGIVGYPLERLQEEVAYIAYHLHWSLDEILALEHADRRRWAEEVAAINRRLNEETETQRARSGESSVAVSDATVAFFAPVACRLGGSHGCHRLEVMPLQSGTIFGRDRQ